ncbi:putative secreted protein (Por secretion system target) [Arcicella aurantiaca]|uniref:Putative secreted protein (Por secretion system target) n=2 Tax=Arcicella aurantiaca TaxID=591202 RepID=A0A316E491_9BACT|nr:putative secreted protein (Por secretion system target) [Arcicella aurantiaca]
MFLMTIVTLSGLTTHAQTDNKHKSRLDIKPKAKTTLSSSVLFKKTSFSLFQPSSLTLDRNINYQRSAYINQYFTNSFLLQPAKTQAIRNEAVAQPVVNAESKVDEFISSEDRLFSNEKLTVSNIYPNPADDHADIDYVISSQVGEAKITFYNILGNEMKEEVLEKDQRKVRVSTKDWNNGIYLYQLSADGKSLVTKKLLVRHQ